MRKIIVFVICALFAATTYAHNGKIVYAEPIESVKIDGKLSDWSKVSSSFHVEDVSGTKLLNAKDFKGSFRIAYNEKQRSLYLAIEAIDDSFSENDGFEVYLNIGHLQKAPSVVMLKFEKGKLEILKHSKFHDPIHQFINKDSVEFKISQDLEKMIFEGRIVLGDQFSSAKTIGFDMLFIDADKDQKGRTYINWGKGYSGSWKEYSAGQLGDIAFVKQGENFGTIEGKISWKEEIKHPLPKKIKIRAAGNPQFWLQADVDSKGGYKTILPVGKFYVSPAYKLSNPLAGDGYDNQIRIDEKERIEVQVKADKSVQAETLAISTFRPPRYLFRDRGVLHTFTARDHSSVDSFVNTYMEYYDVPGASIALIKDGKIVYHKVFGVQSLLTDEPVNKNTLFQAASVTKPVFAFIVNRLADRGVIDLDKPLYQYLPFKNIAHNKGYKSITGRIVLSHQSGLPNWAWGGPFGWKGGAKTDLLFPPGSKFKYSGEAFQYLGRVVEHITGKDLNQLLKEEVILPLKMPKMYFNGEEGLNMAQGHIQGQPTFWQMPAEPGVAHTLMSEAGTFARFVVALIDKKGLSEKRYEDMFSRRAMATGFPPPPDNSYWNLGTGLGFFIQDTPYGKAIMHGGSNWDFQSEFVFYPEKKMGFVVFANSNSGHKLVQELGAFLINERD